ASRDKGKGSWDTAAAWQHLADVPKRGFGRPVIKQHPILIITQGEQGFSRVRLQFLRILQRTFGGIPASGSEVVTAAVKKPIRTRKPRPTQRKIGVKLHRTLKKTDGFS